jgi:hypothetical protein
MQSISRQQLGKHVPARVVTLHNNTESVFSVRVPCQRFTEYNKGRLQAVIAEKP